jgi:(hydroxyamino)benzene mutase
MRVPSLPQHHSRLCLATSIPTQSAMVDSSEQRTPPFAITHLCCPLAAPSGGSSCAVSRVSAKGPISMPRDSRLLFHGFLLFLLGLGTGLIAYRLENPRMGVSAHVEAILNGVFLVGLGLAWSRLQLGPNLRAACFWSALVGAYANWAIPLFSAAVGASHPLLLGSGYRAAPWQEALISASPVVGVLPPILCGSLAVWGLRRSPHVA